MTTRKQALRSKIAIYLDGADTDGLICVLDRIEERLGNCVNSYQLFAGSVFIDRTRNLSDKPMPSVFNDAISESLSIMVSPEEAKEIKKLARTYGQIYKAEEAVSWARQFMLVYRTGIYYHSINEKPTTCKVCDNVTPTQIIMLNVGLQAGPFCRKCLRRIPKSWYCQK